MALICLALLFAAVRGRRWQLCRLIALGGVAAIAVGLIIDRPAGLDPGDLDVVYTGVKANLLGGFYAQLFAGLLLAASALLLGREIRLAGDAAPARKDRPGEEPPPNSPRREGRGGPRVKVRAELILPVTIVAAATILAISEFMVTFEFTPPGGEALDELARRPTATPTRC